MGDIILCAQIAHRLYTSMTKGRKQAPQDLQELQNALFGLCYALDTLKHENEAIAMRTSSEHTIAINYMIQSCQETLHQLDNDTAQYREAIHDRQNPTWGPITPIRTQLKIQWKRLKWSFRGDTLTKYRSKLQTYTDSLNLLLSTFLW